MTQETINKLIFQYETVIKKIDHWWIGDVIAELIVKECRMHTGIEFAATLLGLDIYNDEWIKSKIWPDILIPNDAFSRTKKEILSNLRNHITILKQFN